MKILSVAELPGLKDLTHCSVRKCMVLMLTHQGIVVDFLFTSCLCHLLLCLCVFVFMCVCVCVCVQRSFIWFKAIFDDIGWLNRLNNLKR